MAFIFNAWYVVALPEEVTDAPLGRTALDMPLVLFRQVDGSVSVLLDICPHRFAALSDGAVRGGICSAHIMGWSSTALADASTTPTEMARARLRSMSATSPQSSGTT